MRWVSGCIISVSSHGGLAFIASHRRGHRHSLMDIHVCRYMYLCVNQETGRKLIWNKKSSRRAVSDTLWSYMMEETGVHGGNLGPESELFTGDNHSSGPWPGRLVPSSWMGFHYPATWQSLDSNPGCSRNNIRQKKYMYVSGISSVMVGRHLKKLGMVGRHNILFSQSILYRNCIFQFIFPHFPQIWQHFAHNSQ